MGVWQEILDFTFTANETSRTFSGLSITKDDFIKVVMHNINRRNSGGANYALYPNNETTATDYHTQFLQAAGTSVSANRNNFQRIHIAFAANRTSEGIAYCKLSENNTWNTFSSYNLHENTNLSLPRLMFDYSTSTITFGTITSLTFASDQTDGIGTGSRIQIYKLAAEKVADITVGTNSTQVDIPFPTGTLDPAIDKDSEYLLVSDISNPAGATAGQAHNLFVNDNTTSSNYNSQLIGASGSNAVAFRENSAIFQLSRNGERGITYSHIKLSNIGAYTSQNYGIDRAETSNIQIRNYFTSSTAENITSITKLNIVASATNGIGAGSRFTLYKLYE